MNGTLLYWREILKDYNMGILTYDDVEKNWDDVWFYYDGIPFSVKIIKFFSQLKTLLRF